VTLLNARGNLLDSNCQVLVNAVNCVGVAGAGLALQFKQRFPEQVAEYSAFCRTGRMKPGVLHEALLPDGRSIVSLPTKRHWRERSLLGDVKVGLQALREYCEETQPTSLALPALGCGLGGLLDAEVTEAVEQYMSGLPFSIHVYGLNVREQG
jgi:O-acetyl-ADP-ribose deacetylase (regulator of RNase III)